MQLIAPSVAHLHELMSWFPDEFSTSVWGGPFFRHPFTEVTFRQDARWDDMASYILTDESGAMIAFGQLYVRAGRAHLARLAVTPSKRGRGIGQTLIKKLIAKGREIFPVCTENSLYVTGTNQQAVCCYGKLGFAEAPPPAEDKLPPDQIFMVRAGPAY